MQETESGIMSATLDQCDLMDYIDEELAAILGHDLPGRRCRPSLSGVSDRSSSTLCEQPRSEVESGNLSATLGGAAASIRDRSASPEDFMFDFGNNKMAESTIRESCGQVNPAEVEGDKAEGSRKEIGRDEGTKRSSKRRMRPASQTYDHIMAERRRREQLSQCFIALSAMVPGLKKLDKTSVLGDTIKYLKQLQERVRSLEEQVTRQTIKSVVLVNRSDVVEDEGSSDEQSWAAGHQGPEIEARVCGKSIMLKVHCEKRKGFLVRLLAEVEKLGLSVVNTSVTPFGAFMLAVTVIAEMDIEISLSGNDIVKALRLALKSAPEISFSVSK